MLTYKDLQGVVCGGFCEGVLGMSFARYLVFVLAVCGTCGIDRSIGRSPISVWELRKSKRFGAASQSFTRLLTFSCVLLLEIRAV